MVRKAEEASGWPLWLAIVTLVVASLAAAAVSDWFVDTIRPAIAVIHISQGFTGLVIVAIAGNAVENVVGIRLAAKDKMDYATSVILSSPLQIALGLTPALVLISLAMGGPHLTLVLSPVLLGALLISTVAVAFAIYDGESTWLEGAALVGLYCIIAATFWWG